MTMIFSSGYSGMGGVNTHEMVDYKTCDDVGKAWVSDVKAHRRSGKGEAFYTCVKIN